MLVVTAFSNAYNFNGSKATHSSFRFVLCSITIECALSSDMFIILFVRFVASIAKSCLLSEQGARVAIAIVELISNFLIESFYRRRDNQINLKNATRVDCSSNDFQFYVAHYFC